MLVGSMYRPNLLFGSLQNISAPVGLIEKPRPLYYIKPPISLLMSQVLGLYRAKRITSTRQKTKHLFLSSQKNVWFGAKIKKNSPPKQIIPWDRKKRFMVFPTSSKLFF